MLPDIMIELGDFALQPCFFNLAVPERVGQNEARVHPLISLGHSPAGAEQFVASGAIGGQRSLAAISPVAIETGGMARRGGFESTLARPERVFTQIGRLAVHRLLLVAFVRRWRL